MRNRQFLLALWLMTFLAPSVVFAFKPLPPHSYRHVSPGGQFVFVMIAPEPPEEEVKHWIEPVAAQIRRIRATYTQSGLYPNDGSPRPLWTVDWYAPEDRLRLAPDGIYLIVVLSSPMIPRPNDRVLRFYTEGQLVKEHPLSELVIDSNRPQQYRGLAPESWVAADELEPANNTYRLVTKEGTIFRFDYRTGEILEKVTLRDRLLTWVVRGLVVGGCSLVFVVLIFAWNRARRRPQI
jgi:hypothetical protein